MRFEVPLTAAMTIAGLLATPACGRSPQDAAAAVAPARPDAALASAAGPRRFAISAGQVDGIGVDELSGLAWDADERLLYAVSDQGNVFHFRLGLEGDAIVACDPVYAAVLTGADAGARGKGFNAEGLTVRNADNGKRGDTELVVSLEGDPPRIVRFSPAGAELGALPVPSPADDMRRYRKRGRGLEAVAFHPAHGLVTAPESPLRDRPDDRHTLYAVGRQWSFARHSPDSRLKALEVLADGSLLALERNRAGSKESQTASLRRVELADCAEGRPCATRTVAVLPPGADNFEGMTLLDPRRILLVSDNGGKASQDTVLALVVRP